MADEELEQGKKDEHIFIFPPQDDTIKFTSVGTVVIDYYTGEVKTRDGCKAEGGRLPSLQKNLKGIKRKSVRSLILRVDKKVRIYTDKDNKQLIPVEAGDLWRFEMLPFRELYIKILSTDTILQTCMASTSLVGFVPVMSRTPSRIKGGRKNVTTAGTAEALGSDTPIRSVNITALRTNTGNVYYGDSDVSSTTYSDVLAPGDARGISIDNLNKIYLDVDTGGEGVSYAYVA